MGLASVTAVPAIMARRPAVVSFSQSVFPRVNRANTHSSGSFLEDPFTAAKWERLKEFSIREIQESFARACHADLGVYPVKIRGQVVIADRPILSCSIKRSTLEIAGTEAIGEPGPEEGLSSSAPHPGI